MKPSPRPTPANRTRIARIARVTLVGVAAALVAIAPFVSSASADADADVNVVFDGDGMGFTATSTKDISNIIVEDCAGETHKHDGLDGLIFVHGEDFLIAAVYVKSGNNGIEGNIPPGAGELFVNVGACDDETSSETTTATSHSSSTTTDEESTTTADLPPTDDDSTEVPFFTSGTALVLGLSGALGGTLIMLRRRL